MTRRDLPLPVGTELGAYRIERATAFGPEDTTYRAKRMADGQRFVLRELKPLGLAMRAADGRAVTAIHDEDRALFEACKDDVRATATAMARVRHPNLVAIHEVVEANGTLAVVFDYVDGRGLDEILKADEALAPEEVDEILPGILDALTAVHEAGALHLDVAPEALVLGRDGVLRVGRANLLSRRRLELDRAFTLEPRDAYRAEEFFQPGAAPAAFGTWTDVYGLGATLFRLATGKRPPNPIARAKAVAANEADPIEAPLAAAAGAWPAPLLFAIRSALAVSAADRPRTFEPFRAYLRQRPEATTTPGEPAATAARGLSIPPDADRSAPTRPVTRPPIPVPIPPAPTPTAPPLGAAGGDEPATIPFRRATPRAPADELDTPTVRTAAFTRPPIRPPTSTPTTTPAPKPAGTGDGAGTLPPRLAEALDAPLPARAAGGRSREIDTVMPAPRLPADADATAMPARPKRTGPSAEVQTTMPAPRPPGPPPVVAEPAETEAVIYRRGRVERVPAADAGQRPAAFSAAPAEDMPLVPARFTVFLPSAIGAERWTDLVLYLHEPGLDTAVRGHHVGALEGRPEPAMARAPARFALRPGAPVTLVPDIPGAVFNPAAVTIAWHENLHRQCVRVRAASDANEGAVLTGIVFAYVGPILVGEVPVSLAVSEAATREGAPPIESASCDGLTAVFPAYAATDGDIADRIAAVAASWLDMPYLAEVLARRTKGWDRALLQQIERAERCQIFWSAAGARSDELAEEWRFAHALGREAFLRPVRWRHPPAPPPEPLAALAFRDLALALE
jgi:serine/threonine protein kinase